MNKFILNEEIRRSLKGNNNGRNVIDLGNVNKEFHAGKQQVVAIEDDQYTSGVINSKLSKYRRYGIRDESVDQVLEKMKTRSNRKCCLFYPEDRMKGNWDLLMTFVLLFSCLMTPYKIAFIDNGNQAWQTIDNVQDILFAIDILVIFNTAFLSQSFELEEDRKKIA